MNLRIVLVLTTLALLPCARGANLAAKVDRGTINVGETTTVSFSGGQLDVAGGNIIGDFGEEFAGSVEITEVDRNHFQLKGLAAGEYALRFSDGKNEVTVRLRVLALAGTLDNAMLVEHYGMRFDSKTPQVSIKLGQTLNARVVNPEVLAKHGLEGTAKGDAVKITLRESHKLALMHVPSGAEAEVDIDDKIISYPN